MVQTLTRHGDRLALLLDQATLDSLGINADTPVSVTVTGKSLVVTPIASEDRRRKFEEGMRDTFERYDDVFRKLAE
jgi:hypothetical protein